jgi:hypothetical protein
LRPELKIGEAKGQYKKIKINYPIFYAALSGRNPKQIYLPKASPLQGFTLGYNIPDFQSLNPLLEGYTPQK